MANLTKATPVLECPPELSPAARDEWHRIVGELTRLAVISCFDRGPLAAYCNAYAGFMEAITMVEKHGAVIKSPNGFPVQSPYLTSANQHESIMLRIAEQFGFTPASRRRIYSYSKHQEMLLEQCVEEER